MTAPFMSVYTIYQNPRDLDAAFAVREFGLFQDDRVPRPGPLMGTADDLETARRLVPPTAGVCLTRNDEDDPAIVETWI